MVEATGLAPAARCLQGSIAPVEHAPPTFFRIQENWHTARESNPLSAGVGARPRYPLADGMHGFRFWNGMMNPRRRPSSVGTSKGALEWRDSCQPLWRRRRLVLVWFHFESLSASGGASPAWWIIQPMWLASVEWGAFGRSLTVRNAFSIWKKKKERTPLPHSLTRQPQVFTTDVSVFGRHTSQGEASLDL